MKTTVIESFLREFAERNHWDVVSNHYKDGVYSFVADLFPSLDTAKLFIVLAANERKQLFVVQQFAVVQDKRLSETKFFEYYGKRGALGYDRTAKDFAEVYTVRSPKDIVSIMRLYDEASNAYSMARVFNIDRKD